MSVQACVWLAVTSLLCPYLSLTCLGKRIQPRTRIALQE